MYTILIFVEEIYDKEKGIAYFPWYWAYFSSDLSFIKELESKFKMFEEEIDAKGLHFYNCKSLAIYDDVNDNSGEMIILECPNNGILKVQNYTDAGGSISAINNNDIDENEKEMTGTYFLNIKNNTEFLNKKSNNVSDEIVKKVKNYNK